MQMLWSMKASSKERLLADALGRLRLPAPSNLDPDWLIGGPFPLLIDNEGRVQREAFTFLRELHDRHSGEYPSSTVRTYAESLLAWFRFLEAEGQDWRDPARNSLQRFRRYLLDGRANSGRRANSRNTVNLRIEVILNFYRSATGATDGTFTRNILGSPYGASDVSLDEAKRAQSKRTKLRPTRRRPRALTREQSLAIYRELAGAHRLIFVWALATGLRRSSLVSISTEDVPVGDHAIAYMTVKAKGGSLIDVPVSRRLIDRTRIYIETDRRLAAAKGEQNPGALFLSSHGSPITSVAYYQAFRRACARAGVRATPHMTRHTFATRLHAALAKVAGPSSSLNTTKVVQHWLGHRSVATTELYLENIIAPSSDILGVLEEVQASAEGGV